APQGTAFGLQLVYLLRPYWINRGLLALGQRFNSEALARAEAGLPDIARCRALFVAGQCSMHMGRYPEAQRYLEESLTIAREIGDKRRVAGALQPLGWAHLGQGDLVTARKYLKDALAAAEELGEPREIAAATTTLAQL